MDGRDRRRVGKGVRGQQGAAENGRVKQSIVEDGRTDRRRVRRVNDRHGHGVGHRDRDESDKGFTDTGVSDEIYRQHDEDDNDRHRRWHGVG